MFFRSLVNFISSITDLGIKLVGWIVFCFVLAFCYKSYWQDLSTFWKFVIGFLIFATILGAIQTFIEKLKK